MRLLIRLLDSFGRYMRINLSRCQALVAEQFLNTTNVGSGIEHVCCETMT